MNKLSELTLVVGDSSITSLEKGDSVVFSPDMKSALTGGADNLIRQWRLDTGKQVLP